MRRVLCMVACGLVLTGCAILDFDNPPDTAALNDAIVANIVLIESLTGEPLIDREKIAEVQEEAKTYFAAIDAVVANLQLFGVEVDPDVLARYANVKMTIAGLSIDVIDDID